MVRGFVVVCIIYRVNLNIIASSSITSSDDTIMLSPQTVFSITCCINHKVTSTLTKVRTSFTTSTFEEADGGVVRGIMSDCLNLSRVDMVVRGYSGCILTTVIGILIYVTVEIYRSTIFNLSDALNMFECQLIMLMRCHGCIIVLLSWIFS